MDVGVGQFTGDYQGPHPEIGILLLPQHLPTANLSSVKGRASFQQNSMAVLVPKSKQNVVHANQCLNFSN